VTSAGNITATVGIEARSLADGTGNADKVSVNVAGNITARIGILAEARAASGGVGDVTIGISSGTVRGETSGVQFLGGAANELDQPAAAVASRAFAILGGTGNDHQHRHCHRPCRLGGGNNLFNNKAGSLFQSDSIVDLGATGLLTNAARLRRAASADTK
jgi:hypothetical protein